MLSSKNKKVLRRLLFRLINLSLSVFPVRRNRVFFLSFYGNSYSDNPKAISEALYEEYGNQFEYIWAVASDNVKKMMPNYVKTCRYNSLRMVYYMITSKVWVSNFCLPKGTYKKKSQYYIQTWHGDKAFKKVMHDVPSRDGSKKWLFETDNANLMIAGSDYGERQFRTAFLYKGEILKYGTPRNDLFFKDTSDLQKKLRMKYHCDVKDRIIMYAPTFRRDNKEGAFDAHFDFKEALRILQETTGDTWKMMIRKHSADKRKLRGIDDNCFIDVSDYPDINELLLITDVLITDYSSVAGDFALTNRVILLYQYDCDEYFSNNRELYFDVTKSPFFCASKKEDIYAFLKNIGQIDAKRNCEEILAFYGNIESGNSSQILAEIINSLGNKE